MYKLMMTGHIVTSICGFKVELLKGENFVFGGWRTAK